MKTQSHLWLWQFGSFLRYGMLSSCICSTLMSVCAMKGIPKGPLAQWGKDLTYYLTPFFCLVNWDMYYPDNRTHYTISQSTVWYDAQLTNDSLNTLIVFRCRNYRDSFISYVHLFSDIPSSDNALSICAGFASDRIGRVYVNSTNMAGMIFFHKILAFRTII